MLRPIQPYIEYALNQDYIAEFLCINKDKPKLACDGKCHLAKQLEKQQENDTKSLRVSLENYPIGFVTIFNISFIQTSITSPKEDSIFHPKHYSFNYHYSCFQPPDIV